MDKLLNRLIVIFFISIILPINHSLPYQFLDNIPIPDVLSNRNSTDEQKSSDWVGAWAGTWGGSLKHILFVDSVSTDGSANVWYTVEGQLQPSKFIGRISGEKMILKNNTLEITYQRSSANRLFATYKRAQSSSTAFLWKTDINKRPIDWNGGASQNIKTRLHENGKEISLEMLVFKPDGVGPFPTVIFNHGSTGDGTRPDLFRHTWYDAGIAHFFNKNGWLVAFPQRRGRGKSDGLYDEGFSEGRTHGYTCGKSRTLAGARRAMDDIDAAIEILKERQDVATSNILLGGQSRGGIISLAYAGAHPKSILGVVNFVGGWLADSCVESSEINKLISNIDGTFKGDTIWIYGINDIFYSNQHIKDVFENYKSHGGNGIFVELESTNRNGHYIIGDFEKWEVQLQKFIDSLHKHKNIVRQE